MAFKPQAFLRLEKIYEFTHGSVVSWITVDVARDKVEN